MASILCNLPLECFDARERFAAQGIELVSYGPPDRMVVDSTHYPFDVEFDPSRESIDTLLARLPAGFVPDFLLLYWPDQEPIPSGLEQSDVPVVGVVSDYNLSLDLTSGLAPFFDVLLCDGGGVDLYRSLGFADVRPFVQYSFKAPTHFVHDGLSRDIDVGFAGNLNPLIQGDREPYLQRLIALRERGVQTEIACGIHGAEYGRFLSRTKIGFNRAVRGEMNLRAFEVPACGAVLLAESENAEVRDFFVPDEEVVLYDDENLEAVVLELLADDARRQRIAAAGHRRVQQYRMSKRIAELARTVGDAKCARPPAGNAEVAFGRARAMTNTWATTNAKLAAWIDAQKLAPDDPRALNDLAIQLLKTDPERFLPRVVELLQQAVASDSGYVPAIANLTYVAARGATPAEHEQCAGQLAARIERATHWRQFDGLLLPPGYTEPNLARCRALATSLRSGDVGPLATAFAPGSSAPAVAVPTS